ncbi:MAG: hypothetical protein AAF850_04715 [Pseudomonadota bacterium]
MLNLSKSTWRALIGSTVIIGAFLVWLYKFDQSNAAVLEWMDYAEIIVGWVVLVIFVSFNDWAYGIGYRYRRKKGVLSFAVALLLSAMLGVGAHIAFFALIVGVSPGPYNEYMFFESMDTLTNPSPTIIWVLGVSIAYCWLFTVIGYFDLE